MILYRSDFKSNHGTETALIRVINDLNFNSDSKIISILSLPDFTAAFDTADTDILIERLQDSVGLLDTALNCSLPTGVILDADVNFESHSNIARTAVYHLKNISKVRRFISQADSEKLVHAFISSRLDYNALFTGVGIPHHFCGAFRLNLAIRNN